jgi:hypothetical protein
MASTASDLLKFEKQGTGENSGTWGTLASRSMSRIEEAIAGMTTITLAGANYTLDDTQYTENATTTSESHLAIIKASGTPGATRQIIVPLRTKTYLMWNATTDSSDMTVGGATGDTVTITNGYLAWVFCDGTNVELASPLFTTAGLISPSSVTGFTVADESTDTTCFPLFVVSATGDLLPKTASGLTFDSSTDTLSSTILKEASTRVALTGVQDVPIPAGAMYAATTSGAASGAAETTTNKIMIKTLDFDTAADEYAQFQIPMPKSWNEGTFTATFYWSHAATTTNFGVAWGIQAIAFGDSDALDATWGTGVVVTDTGGTTDDIFVTSATAAVTAAGTPAAADILICRVYRDVSDAADDMAIDARLHGVILKFTTDAGNDA